MEFGLRLIALAAGWLLFYFAVLKVARHRYKTYLPLKAIVVAGTIGTAAFAIYLAIAVSIVGLLFLAFSVLIGPLGVAAYRQTVKEAQWDRDFDPGSSGLVKAVAGAVAAGAAVITASIGLF